MSFNHNLAVKLCGYLQAQSDDEVSAREWRLVGQEQDGSQLLTWLSNIADNQEAFNIGLYTNKTKAFKTLHTFVDRLNIIQASVNHTHSLLLYVVKKLPETYPELSEPTYHAFIVPLTENQETKPLQIHDVSKKQVMVQFLYCKSHKYSHGSQEHKFLLLTHLESVQLYRARLTCEDPEDETALWKFSGALPSPDTIVKVFSWAQWDLVNQVLYYIHYRVPAQSVLQAESESSSGSSSAELTPTLSALQFHADLPHETVLNIPLNLPHVCGSGQGPACGQYADDPLPLRLHDCSIDLQIVSDPSGLVCICHHYLYKPLDDSTSSLLLEDSAELKDSGVNFAYSITLLHHGCVVHGVVPDLPWTLAKSLRPSYTLYGDNHLLVSIPMLFTHLLDIGLSHEPCCHIVLPSEHRDSPALAPILGWGPSAMVDLNTLDVVTLGVAERDLVALFKSDVCIENKLAVLHYMIQHEGNMDVADELMSWLCVHQRELAPGQLQRAMHEHLVGSTYASTRRALPACALPYARCLPFTLQAKCADVKIKDVSVAVSQERLWNSAVVLLSPRQRLSQFAEDLWTRLWEYINQQAKAPQRFNFTKVLDKLKVSLDCYQPEALSRCATPLSPCGAAPALATPRRPSAHAADMLPFFEVDVCTASKQEHIIAVNLREMSTHLVLCCGPRAAASEGAALHAVSTRWASTQLDASRALCRAVCKAMAATPHNNHRRGFAFIDELEDAHALILLRALEQYYTAVEAVAYPLPQGFTSFFAYLGHRALPPAAFFQYVHRHVFELQIDVVKAIVVGKEDSSATAVSDKLRLIQLIGEGRARRVLCAWPHRAATQLRARDHAATLLSGRLHAPPSATHASHASHRPHRRGVTTFPSGERLSPLDTFLDLLTAKASLNELDFNLIIEATLASINNGD